MGREIPSSMMTPTPMIQIREKGKVFKGLKTATKPGKKAGSFIYVFKIEAGTTADTVIPTGEKDAKGNNVYATCDVDLGDEVAIFGDTQLNDKLGKVNDGEHVTITSKGKEQSKSGNWFNSYKVEVD